MVVAVAVSLAVGVAVALMVSRAAAVVVRVSVLVARARVRARAVAVVVMAAVVVVVAVMVAVALVGNVGDMSVTCRTDTSMLANFPDIPFFCRHPFLPIWPFSRVFMSGYADISLVTQKYKTIYNTQNRASKKTLQLVVIFWPHHAYYYLVGEG